MGLGGVNAARLTVLSGAEQPRTMRGTGHMAMMVQYRFQVMVNLKASGYNGSSLVGTQPAEPW